MLETNKLSGRSLIITFIICLFLTACNSKSPSDLVQKAEEHLHQGNVQAAIIQLRSVLEENGSLLVALNLLNKIYADRDQYTDIIYLLSKAEKEGVDDEGILLSLMDALIQEGEFEQALSVFKKHPGKFGTAHGLSLVGHAYAGLNRSAEANDYFQRALKKDSHLISAHIGLAQEAIISAERNRENNSLPESEDVREEGNKQKNGNAWVVKNVLEIPDSKEKDKDYQKKISIAKKHLEQVVQLEKDNVVAIYLLASIDYLQKKYKQANESLERVLLLDPNHKESLYLTGKLHLENGQLEKGKDRLQRYIDLSPDDLKANMYLASIMLRQNQADKSILLLDKLYEQGKADAEYQLLIGNAYLSKQENLKALEHFKLAYEIMPESALVKLYLAMGYLASEERREAITLLESVLKQEPKNKQASLSLATTLLQVEEYQKAKNVVVTLTSYYPEEPVPYYLSGMANESMGDKTAAIESYKKALHLNHAFVAVTVRLAALYQREGNSTAAIRQYEEGLYSSPYNPEILAEMALFEQERGNNELFIEHLELARDRNADAITCRLLLGSYYLRSGRVSESQVILKELHDFSSRMPRVQLFFGQVKLATGEYVAAAEIFSNLVKLEPDSPELLTYYGSALVKSGRNEDGIKALHSAIGLSSRNYPEALFEYGQALQLQSRDEEAINIANELKRTFSDLPSGYNLLGDIAVKNKDFSSAIKFYEEALARGDRTQFVLKLFNAYRQFGRVDKANKLLAQAVENNPDNIRLGMTFASIKLAEGKQQTVIELYQNLLDTYPDNSLILNNLAWMYEARDRKKALELAERAYQVTPDLPEIIDTFGWFCVHGGRLAEGLNLLKAAVNKSPADPEFRYHLAEALSQSGERSSAKESLELALASKEEFNGRSAAEALFQKLSREN